MTKPKNVMAFELSAFESLALSLHHAPGAMAVLIGSGLSRSAGIPTGWEITLDLISNVARLRSTETQLDWAKWYRDEFSKDPSYSEILDALGSTPSERRAILHRYIEAPVGEAPREPTAAHRSLARLVKSGTIRVIITTNFDRLLENAFREVGIEPTVIASDDALKGAAPLVHSECTVIKLHGDYLDARILNTQDELEHYPAAIESLLDRVFDEYGLLVAGWSGEWDTALRKALIRAPNRRYSFYWAAKGAVNSLARDIVSVRLGQTIEIEDADNFFTKLADAVAALSAGRRPHPESLAITLALAKKYAREDLYALEWSELLRDEVAKVRAFVGSLEWPQATPNAENINALMSDIVGRTEALRRICLIGERWGTVEAQRTIERALTALNLSAVPLGGFTWWSALRNLPAALCFEWALAGALYRANYSGAFRLMKVPIRAPNREEMTTIGCQYPMTLFDSSLEWKILAGFNNKKFPASCFLEQLFCQEASDIVMDESETLPLFDETEFLISLEYAHFRVSTNQTWFWTPLGNFLLRDRGSGEKHLTGIEALPDGAPMLAAGLLGGTPASAKTAVDAVRVFLAKHEGSMWW